MLKVVLNTINKTKISCIDLIVIYLCCMFLFYSIWNKLHILFLFPSGRSECWASNTTDEKGIVNLDLYTIIPQISTKWTITFHLKLLIIKHEKKLRHMTRENQVLACDRNKNVTGLSCLMGF
jgi:hypothetical protein